MLDAAYAAWRDDIRRGLDSVLATETTLTCPQRTRPAGTSTSRISGSGPEVELAEGARASTGDIVITRGNDRRLRSLNGDWVRNGDRWLVLDVRRDGLMGGA